MKKKFNKKFHCFFLLFAIYFVVPHVSLANEGEAKYINLHIKEGGENGYNIVNQRWVNDETINVICRDPGYESCRYVIHSALDIGLIGSEILENYQNFGVDSGTIVVNGSSIEFNVTEFVTVTEGKILMKITEHL